VLPSLAYGKGVVAGIGDRQPPKSVEKKSCALAAVPDATAAKIAMAANAGQPDRTSIFISRRRHATMARCARSSPC
jgi:hypothetical protein